MLIQILNPLPREGGHGISTDWIQKKVSRQKIYRGRIVPCFHKYYCIIVQWNFHNRIHLLFQMGASHTDTYRTRLSYVFTWLQCTFLVTSIITGNSLLHAHPKPIYLWMLQIKPLQTIIRASWIPSGHTTGYIFQIGVLLYLSLVLSPTLF